MVIHRPSIDIKTNICTSPSYDLLIRLYYTYTVFATRILLIMMKFAFIFLSILTKALFKAAKRGIINLYICKQEENICL